MKAGKGDSMMDDAEEQAGRTAYDKGTGLPACGIARSDHTLKPEWSMGTEFKIRWVCERMIFFPSPLHLHTFHHFSSPSIPPPQPHIPPSFFFSSLMTLY